MSRGLLAQRLAALFAAAALAFNYPLLGIWDRDTTVFGVPLFPAALFGVWLAVIALLAWWMERAPADPRE